MTKYAETVGQLIAQLQALPAETPVIGMECAVGVAAIPQDTGRVLLAGRRAETAATAKLS